MECCITKPLKSWNNYRKSKGHWEKVFSFFISNRIECYLEVKILLTFSSKQNIFNSVYVDFFILTALYTIVFFQGIYNMHKLWNMLKIMALDHVLANPVSLKGFSASSLENQESIVLMLAQIWYINKTILLQIWWCLWWQWEWEDSFSVIWLYRLTT